MDHPFPRQDDNKGHAWGLLTDQPEEVWERFSHRYETQAETVWKSFEQLDLIPSLEWAGSQDGEAIIGRNSEGEILALFHLEDPEQAEALQTAIATGNIISFIAQKKQELEGHISASDLDDS